ncbi:hypothetical protein [Streptococcus equinus]|uniref:hypothetical protein n=1 Tax=Streptococcus equinus TaxID=1335 RepID=UPI001FB3CB3B|nr:hypothetical protein [Streptococcus equinus]UOC11444.1 hypothetical protein KIP81_01750 [Streptococcus equinus]
MASKKWMEYQNMTTRAKHFGGANNYQAFLVMAGSLGGAALLKGGEFIFNKFKSIRNGKIEDELLKVTYEVTNLPEELSDEFGDAKNIIKVGSKFRVGKVFEIEGEKSLFIEIVGDDNNPYLLREKIVEKISNYKLSENMD